MNDDCRKLLDQQEIRDVLAEYCEMIDEHNIDAVVALFTPDCVTDYGPGRGGVVVGVDALKARFEGGKVGYRHAHHQLGQIRIKLDGDAATSVAYVIADHEKKDGSRATIRMQYRDTLRRTAEGWRIAHRKTFSTVVDNPGESSGDRVWLPRADPRP